MIPAHRWALVLGLGALLGCAASAAQLRSAKSRDLAPQVLQPDLQELIGGNSAFAFDLYHALGEGPRNLFFSPHSISVALAMAYAGARTQTEKEMGQTLHFSLPQSRLHPAFNSLDLALASRGRGARGVRGPGFNLSIANSLWGQKGYSFLPAFLDTLALSYGAGLNLADFVAAPDSARQTINTWARDQTRGRIEDMVPERLITSDTRLVLANAVYFDAAWAHSFGQGSSRRGEFTLLDGTRVQAQMMRQLEQFPYAEGPDYQAIELPYDGEEIAMVLVVPRPGEFARFEQSLSANRAEAILHYLEPRQVSLTMPKFGFRSALRLDDALSTMGMPSAFRLNEADFSGMDGRRLLFIDFIVHQALVRVDEQGTEAAAATAVGIAGAAAPATEVVTLVIDRPFIFFIRDRETGAIIFLGRVLDPRQ